jgi:tetratricopeptide (TPR) repeat protein
MKTSAAEAYHFSPFPFHFSRDRDKGPWRQLIAAEGYTELGMYAEAHQELDLADQHEQFRMEVAARRLDVFLAQERWKDAAIYGEIMTEFFPDEPEHFMKYATALHELGQTGTAIYALSLAPADLERDPDYQFRLAGYELVAGTREEALFHLENAIALDSDRRESARRDPQLMALVDEVPDEPRFIPSQPPYEPEPGEEEEWTHSELYPFGDPNDDFDCPF